MTAGLFSVGVAYATTKRKLQPARFSWLALLIAPLAFDGLTQLARWRESNWPLRVTTGMLFGAGSGWFLYPRLLVEMRIAANQAVERGTAAVAASAPAP